MPGIRPALMDDKGHRHPLSQANLSKANTQKLQGNLVVEYPWPGMIRTVWGDHKRCKQTYFSAYPGNYFTGDGCFKDTDQDYRITGRVDDVLNVSGHRIGTAEVENAINACENVIESAVIGYPHPIKGEGIYAYIICQGEVTQSAVNDKIKDISENIELKADYIIDGTDLHLMPGVIDDQVHFREPGLTHKATIYTESKAAVAGGITSFMEMPNTQPQALTQELLEKKYELASNNSLANYSFFMGASNDNLKEVLTSFLLFFKFQTS